MRRIFLVLVFFLAACQLLAAEPAFEVRLHPDGPLFVGDQVSFEILSPDNDDLPNSQIQAALEGKILGEEGFAQFGVGQRSQATFWWVWDTGGFEPGFYTITFSILPDGPTWNERLRLRDPDRVPAPEPDARWASTESDCCLIYYITGTDAERGLDFLVQMVDEQAAYVEQAMYTSLKDPILVTFLPRTLGHGGFASNGIYVSYLDENYAGGVTSMVIRHEMVHDVDRVLGGDYRPSILVEGLAVFASGGHFKPEPLRQRAAALTDVGWYIPLQTLVDNFYFQQHEIEYLEAGALVAYLTDTYGWEAFDTFYRDIHLVGAQTPSEAIESALRVHFDISLNELEQDFLAYLDVQEVTEDIRDDLLLTVELYDAIRRYQELLDPSAYFLTAWLPDGPTMQERGIVADYLRRPRGLWNKVIESQLLVADGQLRSGDFDQLRRTLKWVNFLLDVFEWSQGASQ